MAILESGETNIFEADAINWRLIVYPLVGTIAIVLIGFGYYYYQLNEKAELESAAQAQMVQAKTPEDFIKIADDFPGSIHATIALLNAAAVSYDAHDYNGALKDYRRILGTSGIEAELHDSAQLGVASALEQTGKIDDAIQAYLAVAQESTSGFIPFAYTAAARLYEQKGDKDNQRRMLSQAANLNIDSPFVKEAAAQLKSLTPEPGGSPLPSIPPAP